MGSFVVQVFQESLDAVFHHAFLLLQLPHEHANFLIPVPHFVPESLGSLPPGRDLRLQVQIFALHFLEFLAVLEADFQLLPVPLHLQLPLLVRKFFLHLAAQNIQTLVPLPLQILLEGLNLLPVRVRLLRLGGPDLLFQRLLLGLEQVDFFELLGLPKLHLRLERALESNLLVHAVLPLAIPLLLHLQSLVANLRQVGGGGGNLARQVFDLHFL
mmetsp:Transcript_8874/g.21615  ORF Transcript_8874/g.21615 Transcript_8874/m.21615 type:complete len:214 (-) Transcript_8874:2485-3126(-)